MVGRIIFYFCLF